MSYVYQPLMEHIAVSRAPELRMSYAEIEKVLGRALPPSTRNPGVKRQWWANTMTHSQAKAWLANGRKAKLDVKTDTVTFVKAGRQDETTAAEIRLTQHDLEPAAVRLIENYAEENGVNLGEAVTALLNQVALRHRRETLDWFAQNAPMAATSSAELVRAEREGR